MKMEVLHAARPLRSWLISDVRQKKMPKAPISLSPDQKTFLLNDAVFYEVLFALGVSAHDSTDHCVWEHLNFSRLGHARALLYFFESPSPDRKWDDDIVSEDFGFAASKVAISPEDRERFNKDLFHLSARRVRHTATSKPWPHSILQKIHERSVSFAERLLQDDPSRDFTVEIPKWEALLRILKDGRELEITRHWQQNGKDSGWMFRSGRDLQSKLSELTTLYAK
jgi:hypothetical protein